MKILDAGEKDPGWPRGVKAEKEMRKDEGGTEGERVALAGGYTSKLQENNRQSAEPGHRRGET